MNRDISKDMILNLVLKDFKAYGYFIFGLSFFTLVLAMFTTFMNSKTQELFTSGVANIIIVVIGSFALEQKANGARGYIASLPLTRKSIVLARYISSLSIILFNFLINLLVFFLLESILKPELASILSPKVILYAGMYLLIHISLYFFFFYRFNLIVVMITYLLPMLLWTALSSQDDSLSASIIGNPRLFLFWCLAGLGLFMVSLFSSLYYYQKKDL